MLGALGCLLVGLVLGGWLRRVGFDGLFICFGILYCFGVFWSFCMLLLFFVFGKR